MAITGRNINNTDSDLPEAPRIDDSIFSSINEIRQSAEGAAKDSISWLEMNAKNLVQSKNDILEAKRDLPKDLNQTFKTRKINARSIGRMFMFIYDPKWKKRLPYYDTLPLILLIDFMPDGFRGLNLHYVPPFIRKKIIEALSANLNKSALTERTKARISYNILKRASMFPILKLCFKRYLYSHVKSNFMYIDPKEWDRAIMLPTEQFKKKTKNEIYKTFMTNLLRNPKKYTQSPNDEEEAEE